MGSGEEDDMCYRRLEKMNVALSSAMLSHSPRMLTVISVIATPEGQRILELHPTYQAWRELASRIL
jgi:hypothetical protein